MIIKKATLLAIIGSTLIALTQLYYLLTNFAVMQYSETTGKIIVLFSFTGYVFIVVFFISLYQKQK